MCWPGLASNESPRSTFGKPFEQKQQTHSGYHHRTALSKEVIIVRKFNKPLPSGSACARFQTVLLRAEATKLRGRTREVVVNENVRVFYDFGHNLDDGGGPPLIRIQLDRLRLPLLLLLVFSMAAPLTQQPLYSRHYHHRHHHHRHCR